MLIFLTTLAINIFSGWKMYLIVRLTDVHYSYHSVYISVVSFTVSPFIKPIKFSFWTCNQGQKTDIFLEQSSLPSLSQDQLNLPIDFFNTAAIHCLWHLAVGSLTPFNQINFIFLSMLCKNMSKNRERLRMI